MTADDPRIAGLVRLSVGIDAYNHLDLGFGPDRDLLGALSRSGFSAAAMALPHDGGARGAFARFLDVMTEMDTALDGDRGLRALCAADVRHAKARGTPAVILAAESSAFLEGQIDRVAQAWRRGVRQLGLGQPPNTMLASSDGDGAADLGGLTAFDLDVLREGQRLGILIDASQMTPTGLRLALKVATRPLLVSRAGLDSRPGRDEALARRMRGRLIDRALAREVADAGGVIGVWTHLAASADEYVANIRAMADVVGISHVCIGSDTKLTNGGRAAVWSHRVWPGQSKGLFVAMVEAMLRAKFSPAEIRLVSGENYLRLFEAATR